MADTQKLAESMFAAAANVLGRLVELPAELGDIERNDRSTSIRTDVGELVTLAELPSVGAQFLVRFETSAMHRLVELMLGSGEEPQELGAMQLSIASESASQIANAMAQQLTQEIGASADGIRAEMCTEAAALPPPPFESFASEIHLGDRLVIAIMLDLPAIAISKLGLVSAPIPEPVVEAREAPASAPTKAKEERRADAQQVSYEQILPMPVRTAPSGHANLDFVHDVPLQISAVLGRTVMPLREVVSLQSGSVFELDKEAVEPVDLYVNNILIARGEVVIVDDKYAVKISELNPQVG